MSAPGAGAAGDAVTAVVLAARGGVRFARTLESLAWTGERLVLDPAGRLGTHRAALGDARHVTHAELEGLATRPWVLLVAEGEVVPPALARAVEGTVGTAPSGSYRIPLELRGHGAVLLPRRAPVRLAPATGARLDLQRGLGPALAAASEPITTLDARLVVRSADTLSEMLNDLDADGATLAALLHARRVRLARGRAAWAAVSAAAALLAAPRTATAPWGRWTLAVGAAYRAIVSYAKAWELAHAAGMTA